MSAQLEAIQQNIAQLTQLIAAKQAAKEDPKATLQWDDVRSQFDEQIKALVAAQVAEKAAAAPQRRIAGTPVGTQNADTLKGNRYQKMVHNFERDGAHKELGALMHPIDLMLAHVMMVAQEKHYHPAFGGERQTASEDLKAAIKAMTSTGTGVGDEIVPYDMARQLWDDIFLASRIVSSLNRVPMPTNPFDLPLGLGQPVWRVGAENTATTASDLATSKSTLTATELVTQQEWSYTLDEDAAVAMAPSIRARLAQSGGEIIDAFALNADATATATGNINTDDGAPPAGSYYISAGQNGLRRLWLADNTAQGVDCAGALTDAKLTAALGVMGKYAIDPNQLMIITDSQTYLTGFLATGTGTVGDSVMTIDKFGPNAVVLTGQLAAYRGIPIVVSASSPLTEADGKVSVTPAGNIKGSITIVNRNGWNIGFRRELLIEADRDITKRMYILVTSVREAIAAWGTRSTAKHTAGLRNIT